MESALVLIVGLIAACWYFILMWEKSKVQTPDGEILDLPISWSFSAYLWKGSKLGMFTFIIPIFVIGLSIAAGAGLHANHIGGEDWSGLTGLQKAGYGSIIVGGFFIMMVGVFADYVSKRAGGKVKLKFHLLSSYVGIGLPLLFGVWAAFTPWYAIASAIFLGLTIYAYKKKFEDYTFWVETWAIIIGFPLMITAAIVL